MKDYVIFADSACDIKPELLAEWGVPYRELNFRFSDSDAEYSNGDMSTDEFYKRMREGGVAKTSAVNVDTFAIAFREIAETGKDILYLGFSSGLSTTYNSARLAAEQISPDYPDTKIITVDTLSASAGFGLLLYLTVEKKKAGATIEEAEAYARSLVPKMCHWFTVDDLVYLKRGGRVSAAAAFFGNMLGIKPVLHMDDAGHLIPMTKVRGRRTSIDALADKLGELMEDKENGTVFISQADCKAEAEYLANVIKTKYGATVSLITDVGTVIGAHSGPGTMALFFVGKER